MFIPIIFHLISFSFITFWGHSSFHAKTAGLAPWCSAVNGLHRAARRQGSFLIGCRRASGAPRAATRSQGRQGERNNKRRNRRVRERERGGCSVWQLARSQRGPAETPRNGQQLPRSRVNAQTKKKGGRKKIMLSEREGEAKVDDVARTALLFLRGSAPSLRPAEEGRR